MSPVLKSEVLDTFFQHFFESLDQGVALLREDRSSGDFVFVRANACFLEFSGFAGMDLCGMLLSEWESAVEWRLADMFHLVRTKGGRIARELKGSGGCWFRVTGMSVDEEHFCLSLRENTEDVRLRHELARIRGLFKGLVEDSGALFCEFDADGVLAYVNGAYCDFFGLDRAEILGKDFYRFIPEGQRQAVRDGIGRLSAEVPFNTIEHQVIAADGSIRWQRWTDRAFFNEDGSIRGYSSVGFDTTARREAEEARREQARHLEALFENSPIGICFSLDRRIRQVNPAFCSLFGFEPEEVIGREASKVISRPGVDREEDSAIRDKIYSGESVTIDVVRYRSDGRSVDVRVVGIPYLGPSGIRGHFTFFQDLADSKKLERETLRNRCVVDQSPVVIYEAPIGFGATCRFISENVSQFGYQVHEVVSGKVSLDMRTHPEDRERLRREVAEAERDRRKYREHMFRLLTADGRYRWVNERNRVLFGPDGEPESLIGVLIDQTELVRAQRYLQDSNERLAHHAKELKEAWEGAVLLLAGVTELRDPYTRGHQCRVADLCRVIGEKMGFEEEPLRELVQAAYVHDIGKMEIPSDYLNRPGGLMPEEMDFIRDHPTKGCALLSRISGPAFLPEVVHQHHERLDGSGYPRGLKDEDILLPSRILAVADVVEAMLSHRPYRSAHSLESVMEEISREAGRLYDEKVVAICGSLFLEEGYSLPPVEDCRWSRSDYSHGIPSSGLP